MGGLFIGAVLGLFGFFVVELVREAYQERGPKVFAAAVVVLYLGAATWGAAEHMFRNDLDRIGLVLGVAGVLYLIYSQRS